MPTVVSHGGTTLVVKDEEKVEGTECRQCHNEMDAVMFALGGETCFTCLKKNGRAR